MFGKWIGVYIDSANNTNINIKMTFHYIINEIIILNIANHKLLCIFYNVYNIKSKYQYAKSGVFITNTKMNKLILILK